jgi:hypothetical protein
MWLDDLERFLGSGGLTGASVSGLLSAPGRDRFIVATIRAEEHAKFSGRSASGFEGVGRETLRQGWDVLRLATQLDLPRHWSWDELARAEQQSHDPRVADAVRHAEEFGVAEYLAAGPQLLAEWRLAWAPATHPRAAAMVQAAVDARRAGIHRPLPISVLAKLNQPYLERRGGERLRPEPFDVAATWATTPLHATSSLLLPNGDGLLAFDYLIDTIEKDQVPAHALDVLIEFATADEAMDIGELAWRWSLIDQAEAAFRHADDAGQIRGTVRRCHLIREERGGTAAAVPFAEAAAERTSTALGPDHLDTFRARSLVAWEIGCWSSRMRSRAWSSARRRWRDR